MSCEYIKLNTPKACGNLRPEYRYIFNTNTWEVYQDGEVIGHVVRVVKDPGSEYTGLTIKMIEANEYMPEERVIYVKLQKGEE